MIFTTLLSYKKKYGKEFGQLVIALDSRSYWRREIFPQYKGNRKKNREASGADWPFIFECMDEVKADLREYFPYKVVEVDGAEADDVIAILVRYWQSNDLRAVGLFDDEPQPILIVSSDTDFMQCQQYKGVKQWSPILKKMIKPKTTLTEFIVDHICVGDAGDGIPNICSPDNCLVDGMRQKSFMKARFPDFINKKDAACANEEEKRNYQRNQRLIDFDFIPKNIEDAIVHNYSSQTPSGSKTRVFNYLIKNRMKYLLENAGDF